jgi:hypothetical protein
MQSTRHVRCPKCGLSFGRNAVVDGRFRPHRARCGRMCSGGMAWSDDCSRGSCDVTMMLPHHADEETCDHPGCVDRRERRMLRKAKYAPRS